MLDFLYHEECCKLISIYLLRETNKSIPQQVDFTEKSEEDDSATIFFIVEK